ncbi:hypothetical protein pb186bvf_008077 [Paramecium bursaria]
MGYLNTPKSSESNIRIASQKIIKLAQKKIGQLEDKDEVQEKQKTEEGAQSHQMAEKVNKLIDRANHKIRHHKIPQDIQFYQRNIKKFENLSSFIPSKGIFDDDQKQVVSTFITSGNNYQIVENRIEKKAKTTKYVRRDREHYDLNWDANETLVDENKETYDVDRTLKQIHSLQMSKERQDRMISEEKEIQNNVNRDLIKQIQLKMKHEKENSEQQIQKDEERHQDDLKVIQNASKQFKQKSDKVIKMIQNAAKKIYNKKDEQIEKEMIMNKIERAERQKQRLQARTQLDQYSNKQHKYEGVHQKLFTNKQSTTHYFFPETTGIRINKFVDQGRASQNSTPANIVKLNEIKSKSFENLSKNKNKNLALQLNGIFDQLARQQDASTMVDLRNIQSQEQKYFKTLRENLLQDNVGETLKQLLVPQPNNRNFRMGRMFRNQIL